MSKAKRLKGKQTTLTKNILTVSDTRKFRSNILLLQWYMFQHRLTGYFNSFALSTAQQSSLSFLASASLFWAIQILGNDANFPKIMYKAKNVVVQIWKVQPSGAREWSSNASGFECQLCKQTEVVYFQTKTTQLVQNKTTFITGLPNPVGICVSFVGFISFRFFSVSVKVLPVTSLLSGVFVHRAFYAYFLRIERVVGNA